MRHGFKTKVLCSMLIMILLSTGMSFAVKQPKVDSLKEGYLIVGRWIIYLPQMTQKHFDAAIGGVTDEYGIYYKSEFAGGTWYKLKECSNIFDITVLSSDNIVDCKLLDSRKYHCQVNEQGVLIKFTDDTVTEPPADKPDEDPVIDKSKAEALADKVEAAEESLEAAKDDGDDEAIIAALSKKLADLKIELAVAEASNGIPLDDLVVELKLKLAANQAQVNAIIEAGGSLDVVDAIVGESLDLQAQLLATLNGTGQEDEANAIILAAITAAYEEAMAANDLDVAMQAMMQMAIIDPESVPEDGLVAQMEKLKEDQASLSGKLEEAQAVADAAAEAAAAALGVTPEEAAELDPIAEAAASFADALGEEQKALSDEAEALGDLLAAAGNEELAEEASEIAAQADDLTGETAAAAALTLASEAGQLLAKYDGIADEDYSISGLVDMMYQRYYMIRSYIEEDDEIHTHSKEALLETIKELDIKIYELKAKGFINGSLIDRCVEMEVNREEGIRTRSVKTTFDTLLQREVEAKLALINRIPYMEGTTDEKLRLEAILRTIYDRQQNDYREIGDNYERFLQ